MLEFHLSLSCTLAVWIWAKTPAWPPRWHPEGTLSHMTSCDTHCDSVCCHAGRIQEDRRTGTGHYLHSARAAGSHRTDSPSCWNRWHRMTGRLWGRRGRRGGEFDCQSLQILIFSPYRSFLNGYRTACHSLAGWWLKGRKPGNLGVQFIRGEAITLSL